MRLVERWLHEVCASAAPGTNSKAAANQRLRATHDDRCNEFHISAPFGAECTSRSDARQVTQVRFERELLSTVTTFHPTYFAIDRIGGWIRTFARCLTRSSLPRFTSRTYAT